MSERFTLTISAETLEELAPYLSAEKNQRLIDGLYDEVFRNKIKHEGDECFEKVWKNVWEYLNERY